MIRWPFNFITNLEDSQREGVGELFLAENESVSRPSVHINTGESVHLGVDPVQTLVDHVCPDTGQNIWRLVVKAACIIQFELFSSNVSMALCLPRVMPLGHTMLSVTKATRSAPFNPLFSILASSPQSVQYMKLKRKHENIWKLESWSKICEKLQLIPNF